MRQYIRPLTELDKGIYESLMQDAYRLAAGFVAAPHALLWLADQRYPTFGVFHDDQLLSVIRLEKIPTWEELYFKMQAKPAIPGLTLPVASTSKGATHPSARGMGLNTILRYHCIKIALDWGTSHLLMTTVEDSPRLPTLREMGFSFQLNPNHWRGAYVSQKRPVIAFLNLQENGDSALRYIESNWGPELKQYHWR